jgi:RND family efflux transporter MFP subunit
MSRWNSFLLPSLLGGCVLWASCGPGANSSGTAENSKTNVAAVDVAKVSSQRLNIIVHLPGELEPFEVVAIYPRVSGFVKWMGVDRGSRVRSGDVIARLEAPELVAQKAEAQAKLQGAESQLAATQAKLAADESTYEKLKAASATPGVVAGNDLVATEKAAEAGRAQVKASQENVNAAKQSLQSITELEGYLQIRAPFDGMVTERNVHPGALVGPAGGQASLAPMLRIETLARLRLVVPVPENYVAGISGGAKVNFTVPAFPSELFWGTVARISHSVAEKTRTMPVELEVSNPSDRLAPGTFSDVLWPVSRPEPTLFVPSSAVATTLERVFVIRIRNGEAEWVDVKTGATSGDLTEIFGDLKAGDEVALRGTDELRPGTRVTPRPAGQAPKSP